MIVIAVTTNSHRQVERLPEGRIAELLNGAPVQMGSRTRLWYYLDTPEMRTALRRFPIHKRESIRASGQLRDWLEPLHNQDNPNYL